MRVRSPLTSNPRTRFMLLHAFQAIVRQNSSRAFVSVYIDKKRMLLYSKQRQQLWQCTGWSKKEDIALQMLTLSILMKDFQNKFHCYFEN